MINKLTVLFCLMLLFSFGSYSQTHLKENLSQKQNELKFNASKSLVVKGLALSYERLLNENNSIGLEVFISLRKKEDFGPTSMDYFDSNRTFNFDAYYRRFFSKSYAKGFFLEGFSSFNQAREIEEEGVLVVSDPQVQLNRIENLVTDLAIGISVGGKFLITKRVVAEIFYGLGTNLLGKRDVEFTSRGGVSLGYRF